MTTPKQPRLKQGEKVLFIMAGVFVVLAIVAFIVMEVSSSKSGTPLFKMRVHDNFNAEGLRGSALFRKRGCTVCHRALRDGTNMGRTADMDGIGSRLTLDYMYKFLLNPKTVYKTELFDHSPGHDAGFVQLMPPKELHAIATFLSQLKADQGAADSPVPPKGDSLFIDTMVNTWAPKEWKLKYHDIRDDYKNVGKPKEAGK
ncbi:MAG: c-type cytochrome [Mariprofundales bacterium]|nr:c-type cytochrome [Mariprofundales bacterium]